ncbi:MAG: hypothetical protein AAFZ01_01425 [Pseudomonadota bacterium]
MKKLFTTATVAIALAFSAAAGSAYAEPTFGISSGGATVNPFADKGGN